MTPRPATPAHMPACEAIYAHHVAHGVATFDEAAPVPGMLEGKRATLQAKGYPFLILKLEDRVAGYAYAAPFRERSAYRFAAEDSIYLHPDFVGRGLAAPLLDALIRETRAQGLKSLIAVIGMDQADPLDANASVRAHAKAGFVHAGVMDYVGYKFETWLKTIYMRMELQG